MGYRLYMASGTETADLDASLRAAGIRESFTQTHGTDIVDTWKGSRYFYDAIFAHSGESPSNVLIVDNDPTSIQWASQAGAIGVLTSDELAESTEAVSVLKSLTELPGVLAR